MGWGVQVFGMNAVIDGLQQISMSINDDAVFVVGTNVTYSVYVEFGTSKMPAQPYLRPAARAVEANMEWFIENRRPDLTPIEAVALAVERAAKVRCPVDTGNLKGSIKTERVV